ncbi:catalytic domain kinase [Rhizoctonia solani AG-3 Rhs1AP]|uniref:non-specific serine/threonine protein kinase n=1 Tax=Rhizoctonia solani AG-3 Rhs1AP TaxID=1086054 RepID=X8J3F6_9AGAM|nr:catalytic domain kinase [Rhizoctonia solani AG-3 Rhs1AP]
MQLQEDGRFIIMRKLGWGMYSSVWLAQDQKLERFVAIKILTCEATQALERQKSDEIAMLQKVAETDRSHEGSRHVVEFYETFVMAGPHGLHRCIVTEPLGLNIDHLRKEFGDARLGLPFVKTIVRQILLGLDYLHNSCGIVHTDLKFDNIMLRPDSISFCVAATLAADPSKAYCFDTSKPPSIVPVESQTIRIWGRPLEPGEVRLDACIVDLGHSHWVDRHFQEHIQPMALRAPEVILGYPWNGSTDVWNLGCLVCILLIWVFKPLTGCWLFEAHGTDNWSTEEDHLVRMTQTLEEQFSLDFIRQCDNRSSYFKEDGTWAHFTEHLEPNWPLRKSFETFSKFADDEEEIDAVIKFLKRCLRLRPEDRATPRELVDDPWLASGTPSRFC